MLDANLAFGNLIECNFVLLLVSLGASNSIIKIFENLYDLSWLTKIKPSILRADKFLTMKLRRSTFLVLHAT